MLGQEHRDWRRIEPDGWIDLVAWFLVISGVCTSRAPKWLRSPVAGNFGWGGKLAYVINDASATGPKAKERKGPQVSQWSVRKGCG